MPVDDAFYSALEEELSSLFENSSVNEDKYISIYSNYLEYIVKIWQSIPDENGLVEHEPTIRYEENMFFANESYCNSKCDVVYLNCAKKHFKLYECKFTLRSYVTSLNYDGDKQQKIKNHRTSRRKLLYMRAFHDIFKNNQIDTNDDEIAFVTLASKTQIELALQTLAPLKIYTIEDIESDVFFSRLYSNSLTP